MAVKHVQAFFQHIKDRQETYKDDIGQVFRFHSIEGKANGDLVPAKYPSNAAESKQPQPKKTYQHKSKPKNNARQKGMQNIMVNVIGIATVSSADITCL